MEVGLLEVEDDATLQETEADKAFIDDDGEGTLYISCDRNMVGWQHKTLFSRAQLGVLLTLDSSLGSAACQEMRISMYDCPSSDPQKAGSLLGSWFDCSC